MFAQMRIQIPLICAYTGVLHTGQTNTRFWENTCIAYGRLHAQLSLGVRLPAPSTAPAPAAPPEAGRSLGEKIFRMLSYVRM